MTDPISTGIQSGVSAVGSVIGYLNARKQFEEQKELMDKSLEHQIGLWKMQNEYMTPKAQIQRFIDAGLNPDLIYGKIGDTSGSVPSVATPQAPDVAGAVSQSALAASQIRLQDSQAQKNDAETATITNDLSERLKTFDERFNQLVEQNKLTAAQVEESNSLRDMYKQSLTEIDARIEYWKTLNFKEAQLGLQEEENLRNLHTRNELINREIISRYRLNDAQANFIKIQAQQLVDSFWQRMWLLNNQSKYYGASSSYYQALEKFSNEQITYLPYLMNEYLRQGDIYFQKDEDGKVIFGDDGKPLIRSGAVELDRALSVSGEVVGQVSDLVGAVVPFAFLKRGFQGFNGKPNKLSSSSGVPSSSPSAPSANSSSGSVPPTHDYIRLINAYQNAPVGSDLRNKLYRKIMNADPASYHSD